MIDLVDAGLQRFADQMRQTYEPGQDDPWWYDNALHFASGVTIGLFSSAIVGTSLIETSLVFLTLALVWELFEFGYGIRPWDERENWAKDRAIEDTLLDTLVGLIGALIPVVILI